MNIYWALILNYALKGHFPVLSQLFCTIILWDTLMRKLKLRGVSDLPKVTEQASGWAWLWTQVSSRTNIWSNVYVLLGSDSRKKERAYQFWIWTRGQILPWISYLSIMQTENSKFGSWLSPELLPSEGCLFSCPSPRTTMIPSPEGRRTALSSQCCLPPSQLHTPLAPTHMAVL